MQRRAVKPGRSCEMQGKDKRKGADDLCQSAVALLATRRSPVFILVLGVGRALPNL